MKSLYNLKYITVVVSLFAIHSCITAQELEVTSSDGRRIQVEVVSPKLPEQVTFAGQTISFDRADMYERLDRELTAMTYTHGTTLLMIKRANKLFPILEPILKKNGVPTDLLYLACVESTLDPLAYSPAKAAGIWQFIPSTAREYGLEVNDDIDERYNIEKATEAACKYLKKAYRKYGNWESVASSYNAGLTRIDKELFAQGQSSSFDLYLNRETSRYMFRILATKIIMEDPVDFGFVLNTSQLYFPIETKTVEVTETIDDLPAWAEKQCTSYQWLKELNPWIRSKTLPDKSGKKYIIKLPKNADALSREKQKKEVFNKNWVCD